MPGAPLTMSTSDERRIDTQGRIPDQIHANLGGSRRPRSARSTRPDSSWWRRTPGDRRSTVCLRVTMCHGWLATFASTGSVLGPRWMNDRFDSTSRPRRSFSTREHRDAEADGDRHVPREHGVAIKDSCRLDGRSPATAGRHHRVSGTVTARTAENPCPLGEGANQPCDGLA